MKRKFRAHTKKWYLLDRSATPLTRFAAEPV